MDATPLNDHSALVYVHGTFSNSMIFESMKGELAQTFPAFRHYDFNWSGINSQEARVNASRELKLLLTKLNAEYSRLVVISHSHGGTVTLLALKDTELTPYVATLGTPAITSQKRRPLMPWAFLLASLAGATAWLTYAIIILQTKPEFGNIAVTMARISRIIPGRFDDGIIAIVAGLIVFGPGFFLSIWASNCISSNKKFVPSQNGSIFENTIPSKGAFNGSLLFDEAVLALRLPAIVEAVTAVALSLAGLFVIFKVVTELTREMVSPGISNIQWWLAAIVFLHVLALNLTLFGFMWLILELVRSTLTGIVRTVLFGKGTFWEGFKVRYSLIRVSDCYKREVRVDRYLRLHSSSFWKLPRDKKYQFKLVHSMTDDPCVIGRVIAFVGTCTERSQNKSPLIETKYADHGDLIELEGMENLEGGRFATLEPMP